jgi:tetratricopeptide (TPR) repeat protein
MEMFRSNSLILGVTTVALCAAYLGAAEGWNQSAPMMGIGLLLIVAPFKALPGRTILLGLLGLVLCSMLGFLPGIWFGSSEWYARLHHAIPGLSLTLSLQPRQTFFSLGVLFAVIFYGIWLIQWRPENPVAGLQAMVVGIGILAAIALVSDFARVPIPIWHPSQGFGPFANRNQTGTLMGLGAIIALGLSGSGLRRSHWTSGPWIAAFALCLSANLLSNSRASLLFLLAATMVWFVYRLGVTVRAFAVGGGVILLITTLALLLGEQVVRRLREFLLDGVGLRGDIYHDTVRLIAAAPFSGIGLGNFAAIFPFFRDSSLNSMRVIHPESDWLWLASEAGIGAILFAIVIVADLIARPAQSADPREKDVLFAGFIGVLTFLGHTLIDVPAHRLGTILPALFVLALCTKPKRLSYRARWIPWLSRVTGIALIGLGLFLNRATSIADAPRQELAQGNWRAARAKIDEALTFAPLDWSLYLMRGSTDIRLGRWVEALGDFRAARVLEPKLAVVPFDEGCAWLDANSTLAIAAWKEALKRGSDDKNLYLQMLDKSVPFPEVHQALLRLSDGYLSFAFAALLSGYSDRAMLDFIASKHSELTAEQQVIFNRAMSQRSAGERDYRRAYDLGAKTLQKVAFPPRGHLSEDEYRIAFLRDPTDFGAAYNLCVILRSSDRKSELLQILESVTKQAGCPDYFYVMKGDILSSTGDWAGAWESIAGLLH